MHEECQRLQSPLSLHCFTLPCHPPLCLSVSRYPTLSAYHLPPSLLPRPILHSLSTTRFSVVLSHLKAEVMDGYPPSTHSPPNLHPLSTQPPPLSINPPSTPLPSCNPSSNLNYSNSHTPLSSFSLTHLFCFLSSTLSSSFLCFLPPSFPDSIRSS